MTRARSGLGRLRAHGVIVARGPAHPPVRPRLRAGVGAAAVDVEAHGSAAQRVGAKAGPWRRLLGASWMARRSKYWRVLLPAAVSNLLGHGLRELLGVVEDQRRFGALRRMRLRSIARACVAPLLHLVRTTAGFQPFVLSNTRARCRAPSLRSALRQGVKVLLSH